jgi:hypothetical protein
MLGLDGKWLVPGAEAPYFRWLDVRAEARTYLRGKGAGWMSGLKSVLKKWLCGLRKENPGLKPIEFEPFSWG